jgi:hypothetical protein
LAWKGRRDGRAACHVRRLPGTAGSGDDRIPAAQMEIHIGENFGNQKQTASAGTAEGRIKDKPDRLMLHRFAKQHQT